MKQRATIYSNDPQQPTAIVTLSGSIKPYLSIIPSPRIMLQGYYGEKLEQKVVITSLTDEPFAITEVTSTLEDKVEYKLATEKKDKEYSITIKTLSGIEESFRGNIILKTTHQKKPEINLTVMGSLKKEVKVAPEYLYFGIIDTGKKNTGDKSLERTAVISQLQANDLTVKNIETSKDWITAKADTDQQGKQYTITIALDRDKLPKGKFRETVTIVVQFKGKSEAATVIVEGKVL